MNEKETGGYVYPDPGRAQSAKQREQLPEKGMTLRDWFAGSALSGYLASSNRPQRFTPEEDATYFYAIADAMIRERSK